MMKNQQSSRKIHQANEEKYGKNLDAISMSFACSGCYAIDRQFCLFIKNQQNLLSMRFPFPKEKDIQTALKLAKKSGFGKGQQNVVDESYRMAFQYLPEQLGLPSYLEQKILPQIIQSISHQLCSEQTIRVELIKLNMYPKGGLFKSHVDTPKKNAFGSLVVFLPTLFEGGQLFVEHSKKKEQFDFGSLSKQNKEIKWVAFFNDCVHEIGEVTSGFRLTLSYNIFYAQIDQCAKIFPNKQIIECLSKLQENKIYGYYCEHYYGNNALQNIKGSQRKVLKGKDAQLFNAAQSLGLKEIQLCIFYRYVKEDDYGKEVERLFQGSPSVISKVKAGAFDHAQHYLGGQSMKVFSLKNVFKAKQIDQTQIEWLNSIHNESKYLYAIDGYYGNDYDLQQSYCELAILIST